MTKRSNAVPNPRRPAIPAPDDESGSGAPGYPTPQMLPAIQPAPLASDPPHPPYVEPSEAPAIAPQTSNPLPLEDVEEGS